MLHGCDLATDLDIISLASDKAEIKVVYSDLGSEKFNHAGSRQFKISKWK